MHTATSSKNISSAELSGGKAGVPIDTKASGHK